MHKTRRRSGDRRGAGRAAWLATMLWAGILCGCTKSISDKNLVMVTPEEGRELADGKKGLLGLGGVEKVAWVDPRGGREYRQGHIPGALSVPFQDLNDRQQMLRGYDALIVYGTDYKDDLADGMSKRLMEMGFKDVRTLRGGLWAWTRAGYEVQTGDAKADTGP